MACLLVEIGNTALKAAWSEGLVLGKTYRYQGEKMMDFIKSLTEREKPEVLVVATMRCVSEDEQKILEKECSHLLILDKNHTDVLLRYDLPEYLSYDRASSLVAVTSLFKGRRCTLFDFGTTLTVDFLDASGHYEGGSISPGCRTRFKSLNRYSKSLPLVDTPADAELKGSSLKSSIESGVISGIMFEIEGYMRMYPDNIMIFTGGDAIYFAKRMKSSIFVVSNLALMGLAIITNDYVEKYIQ